MLKVFRNLKVYKWLVLLVIGLVFVQAMSELFLPTLMGNIVDNGVVKGDVPYIWKIGAVMLGVTAISVIAAVTASYYSSRVAMGLGRDVRRKLFTHVESFSLEEFDKIGTASLITRTTNDITQIQQVTIMMMRMMITAPIMFAGGIIMAVSKDAKLTLVILGIIPFLAGAILIILKKGMPLFKAIQKRLDKVNLVLRENLTGIRVIRAFNRQSSEKERLEKANYNLTDVSIRVNRIMAFLMPVMMLLMNLTIVSIIWFGSSRIEGGNMAIGDLMAFIQYVMMIMFSILMASVMFVMLPRASVSAHRIYDVLETESTIEDKGTKELNMSPGTLEFDNVTFYYPGAEAPVLENITFKANPGEVTAIIGGTGAGKSTLSQLIPRFYDVTEGSVKVNGIDVRDAPQEKLRNQIGYVTQQALLFSGTIRENITFGKNNATDQEIMHAAETAQAQDFIMNSEKGLDSIIEQGGSNISGGQKQRLAIARALVRDADVYVFDDSFSALDYKTDANLRKALMKEAKEATLVIVGQRVNSVKDADRIIVLDKGKAVGIGTHEELLEINEVYQEIVMSQTGEEESI